MARLGVPLDEVDLSQIAEARDSHDEFGVWWFDPATGETIPAFDEFATGLDEDEELDTSDLVRLEPRSSRSAYLDRIDFSEAGSSRRALSSVLR